VSSGVASLAANVAPAHGPASFKKDHYTDWTLRTDCFNKQQPHQSLTPECVAEAVKQLQFTIQVCQEACASCHNSLICDRLRMSCLVRGSLTTGLSLGEQYKDRIRALIEHTCRGVLLSSKVFKTQSIASATSFAALSPLAPAV
jgi:hypothetical protein